MIVFIAGMPRSGSTFSFNIVRRLLETRGSVHQEPTFDLLGALERAGEAKHLLLKAHQADDVTLPLIKIGAVKAVCTVRKPEDAIASWMTTFGFTLAESLDATETWLRMFSAIRPHALIVPFEEIDRKPKSAAWKIARYVCDDADELIVEEIASDYTKVKVKDLSVEVETRKGDIEDIGFSFYDKRTFFHRSHVSAVESLEAIDRIGADQVMAIRQALVPWCDEQGNLIL
jgi:hypothetical protein